jgi:general secretion pathway protein G
MKIATKTKTKSYNALGKTHHFRSAQTGFSLIEILLVVGIIAFLAVMVGANVIGQGEATKQKNALTATRMIVTKAQQFYLDTGAAPSSFEELINKPANAANWRGPYLTAGQDKDPWQQTYSLKAPGEHGEVDVTSAGPDKQHGTADDIGNWMASVPGKK